jgi:tetratricopeptide (TPR) repeat protein
VEKEAPLIFVSYAHADDGLRLQFETALSSLTRQGLALAWTDPQITAGAEWRDALFSALERANVIVLLISPAFLRSDFCYLREMPKALERHERGECVVIPVLIRPTPKWETLPFATLQVLPTRGLPVTNWADQDDAWSDVVQGIADAVRLPEQWPRTAKRGCGKCGIFQAPDPDAIFVGRTDDVEAIERMLLSDKQTVVIRGGLGGLGKTSLAQQTAHQMRQHFTGGVLWGRLPADDANSLLRSMLAGAGLLESGDGSLPSTYEAAKRRLDKFCSAEPVLIVLDNADTADDVAPFIPTRGPARVLVTTRHGITPSLPNAAEWQIEPLGDKAGQELIAKLTDQHTPGDPDAARLVSAMGGLPLAIRIAAGIMREFGWSVRDYLQQFEQTPSLDWLETGDSKEIRRSFAISYDRLADANSRRLFRAIGAFQEAAVRRHLLPAASGLSKPEVELALLALSRRGLCRIAERDVVTLHPLMSRYANELLRKAQESESVHFRIGAAYREDLTLWDPKSARHKGHGAGVDTDAVPGLAAARHFEEAGSLDEAQDCLEAVADVLMRRGNEITLLRRLESLRARAPLKPWLEVYWADLEIDSRWSRDRVGESRDSKDSAVLYAEARQSLETLSMHADRKVASAALICLALIELRANREPAAAELLNRSLHLKEGMEPPDRRGIAYILNEIGRVGTHTGISSSEALELHRRALQIQREIGDEQGIAYTLRRIGSIELRHLNDATGALSTLEAAEQLAAALSFKLVLVTILIEKAEALRRLEYYARAEENLLRADRLARESDNPFTEAQVQRRLASLYERVELYGKGLDCLERSIALYELVDPAEARKHLPAKERVQKIIRRLEEDARVTEVRIQDLRHGGRGPQLRVEARKLRGLEEKLNRIPGRVRLGKK